MVSATTCTPYPCRELDAVARGVAGLTRLGAAPRLRPITQASWPLAEPVAYALEGVDRLEFP